MNLAQLFRTIWARKWIVVICFLSLTALTAVVNLMTEKKYTATTTVVTENPSQDPVLGGSVQVPMLSQFMATQIDIIASHRVVDQVIKENNLESSQAIRAKWQKETEGQVPIKTWLLGTLLDALKAYPSHESRVIFISVTWSDAKTSAFLANAFARAYISTTLEMKVDPAREYAGWFDERTKAVRAEMEAAQSRLSEYQRRTGIVASDERFDVENARLNELSSQLVVVQSLRHESQSRQGQTGGNKEFLPEVVQNPLVSSLKGELAKMEARRQEIVLRLGSNHPEYQRTQSEVDSLRERLNQEISKVASAIGTSNQVNVERESQIRQSLEAQRAKVLALKRQRDEIAVLQREVESAQRAYDLVTQRLAQTDLESRNQQPSAMVLSPALEPPRPSSPRTFLNTLLAGAFGILLGIGIALILELANRRIRVRADIVELVGIPVLAVIGGASIPRRKFAALPRPQ